MSDIILRSAACYTDDPVSDRWCKENCDIVSSASDDIKLMEQDAKFAVNEKVAVNVMYAVAKCIAASGKADEMIPERTGITMGSYYGCQNEVYEAHIRMAEKAEKGITPKQAVNMIPYGMSSKIAIKYKMKAFNLSLFSGNNSGMDSVISAIELIEHTNADIGIACAGDAGKVCASLMLERGIAEEGDIIIKGGSKAVIFGNDISKQFEFVISSFLRRYNISYSDISRVVISDKTNALSSEVIALFSGTNAETEIITDFYPENIGCSEGIFSILYGSRKLEKSNYALISQIDENGVFSFVFIKKA